MIPNSRETFKEYCLRKLGKPVILINVDDVQVDDRIDDALQMFYEYHFDGKESSYIVHEVTAQEVINGYLSLPDTVFGVADVVSTSTGSSALDRGIFNIEYQIQQSDYFSNSGIYSFAGQMTDYYMMKRHLNLMQFMLDGPINFDYNRKTGKLYVRDSLQEGIKVILKVYTMFETDSNGDPTVTNVWNDEWVKKYAVELIRQQWGQNLGKFAGVQMPGGVTLNGLELYDRATQAIEKLETDLKDSLQEPADFFVG